MSDPLFSAPDPETIIDPTKDYLSELVGEGKKFTDAAALARGKAEADAHIRRLEREAQALRTDLENSVRMKEFLDNLKSVAPTKTAEELNAGTPPREPNADVPKGLSLADVEKLMQERERSARENQNLEKAVSVAKQAFGANYGHVLSQKAEEMGISKEWLTDVAKTNPTAFLKLVGAETGNQNTTLFPQSSVRSVPQNNVQTKNLAYYQKLRKDDPVRYHSREVQMEMHREAEKQGDSFFNS